jgi:hypothetical protein
MFFTSISRFISYLLSFIPVTGVEQSSTKIISEGSSSGKSVNSNILPIAGVKKFGGPITHSKKVVMKGVNRSGGEETVKEATSRAKIDRIIYLLVRLFDDSSPISYEGVKKMIEASFCARDHEFTADRAHQDGGVFDLEAAVGDRDLVKFLACGSDLTRMTIEAQSQVAEDRLSVSRVQALISPTDPDYDRILSLAKDGFHVPRDPTSQPVSDPPGLRNLYIKVSAAINRLLVKEWHNNQCFILPTEITRKIEGRHYAPIHWVPKPVEEGEISLNRKLVDHSDLSSGHSLNAGTSREQAEDMYGELKHRMFLRVVNKYG